MPIDFAKIVLLLREIALFYTNFKYSFSNMWSKVEGHKNTFFVMQNNANNKFFIEKSLLLSLYVIYTIIYEWNLNTFETWWFCWAFQNTASDRFSGHGYSGNDRFSGTKPSDDAILFTNSGITALVELFFWKFSKKNPLKRWFHY